MDERICVNLGMDSDVPWLEQLDIIKNAGFDGIFVDWERDIDLHPIIEKARRLGLFVQSLHAPFYGMDDIFHDAEGSLADKMISDLYGTIDACYEFGIDLTIFHAIIGMDNHSPNELGLKRLEKVIDYAEKKGVRIAFENTEGEEYLKAIIDRFGNRKHIGFCIDTGHAMCYNAGSDIFSKFGKYLFSTHLNDNMGQTGNEITFYDDSHLLPFDGIADWNKIAENLIKYNFQGPFTYEFVSINRPERHTSDRYEKMPFDEYVNEAYEKSLKFKKLYFEKLS